MSWIKSEERHALSKRLAEHMETKKRSTRFLGEDREFYEATTSEYFAMCFLLSGLFESGDITKAVLGDGFILGLYRGLPVFHTDK
jgi:hypothetical protein